MTKYISHASSLIGILLLLLFPLAQGAFYGNPPVIYDNVLFSLAEKNLQITTPIDLINLSVVAFQGARKRYPTWADAAKKNGHYFETSQQHLQSKMLLAGRVDLVLSDRTIFKYFLRDAIKDGDVQPSINVHSVFTEDPMNYRPVFHSRKIRDDFNAGLAQLISTGRHQELYDYYTK